MAKNRKKESKNTCGYFKHEASSTTHKGRYCGVQVPRRTYRNRLRNKLFKVFTQSADPKHGRPTDQVARTTKSSRPFQTSRICLQRDVKEKVEDSDEERFQGYRRLRRFTSSSIELNPFRSGVSANDNTTMVHLYSPNGDVADPTLLESKDRRKSHTTNPSNQSSSQLYISESPSDIKTSEVGRCRPSISTEPKQSIHNITDMATKGYINSTDKEGNTFVPQTCGSTPPNRSRKATSMEIFRRPPVFSYTFPPAPTSFATMAKVQPGGSTGDSSYKMASITGKESNYSRGSTGVKRRSSDGKKGKPVQAKENPIQLQHAFSIIGGRLRRENKEFPIVAKEVRGNVSGEETMPGAYREENGSSAQLRYLDTEEEYCGLTGKTAEERQIEQDLLDVNLLDPLWGDPLVICPKCDGYVEICPCEMEDVRDSVKNILPYNTVTEPFSVTDVWYDDTI